MVRAFEEDSMNIQMDPFARVIAAPFPLPAIPGCPKPLAAGDPDDEIEPESEDECSPKGAEEVLNIPRDEKRK